MGYDVRVIVTDTLQLATISKLLIVIEMGQQSYQGKIPQQINFDQKANVPGSSEDDAIKTETGIRNRIAVDMFNYFLHSTAKDGQSQKGIARNVAGLLPRRTRKEMLQREVKRMKSKSGILAFTDIIGTLPLQEVKPTAVIEIT